MKRYIIRCYKKQRRKISHLRQEIWAINSSESIISNFTKESIKFYIGAINSSIYISSTICRAVWGNKLIDWVEMKYLWLNDKFIRIQKLVNSDK